MGEGNEEAEAAGRLGCVPPLKAKAAFKEGEPEKPAGENAKKQGTVAPVRPAVGPVPYSRSWLRPVPQLATAALTVHRSMARHL